MCSGPAASEIALGRLPAPNASPSGEAPGTPGHFVSGVSKAVLRTAGDRAILWLAAGVKL